MRSLFTSQRTSVPPRAFPQRLKPRPVSAPAARLKPRPFKARDRRSKIWFLARSVHVPRVLSKVYRYITGYRTNLLADG